MKFHVNSIIRTLVASDFFFLFSLGLITPVFALFIVGNIAGATIQVVGYATAAYWIARVLSVMFVTKFLDMTPGNRDEYYALVGGTFVVSLLPLFLMFASEPWHVYVIQALNGLANAFAIPAWRISFTRYVNRKAVGQAWSLDDVSVGVATAISGALGATIAANFGFDVLLAVTSVFGFISTCVLATLYRSRSFMGAEAEEKSEEPLIPSAPVKVDGVK